jgi:hypothetical protein
MDDVLRIPMVREQFEGVGMLPKCIDQLLHTILAMLAEALVIGKSVGPVSPGIA